jgi:putative transposase
MAKSRRDPECQSLRTYGRGRALRHANCDYTGEIDVHLTICAAGGRPFANEGTARLLCESVEYYARKLSFRLYGYCLMPDHLHVLLSPSRSCVSISRWLREFKSYATRKHQLRTGDAKLWQRSAHDHVCRDGEAAESILTYIINNPVRAGLVERWQDWRWTRVFIEV